MRKKVFKAERDYHTFFIYQHILLAFIFGIHLLPMKVNDAGVDYLELRPVFDKTCRHCIFY